MTAGKVRVRLFARLGELAGTREAEVELGEDITVADVYAVVCRRYPGLAETSGPVMYAVNQVYASPETAVRDGDEVALIPPVSGGRHAV